ncbi:ABC-type transport auxiliary lipoprotein family protein [Billgrantia endophytica]|uniref:ABC-type transport auxiliary lipoprotein component domain-containing protein n=1 Tax=Billgrantia endophytica TaxID=2033802 RepID=A0A2N7UAL8_9GAMM|nr:ABC-type transport auxiliary lipoprotein family protein [Halomonas endophytica]PMR77469.1 hypothetical protein C1H69_02785 [Halomonas endophytica]
MTALARFTRLLTVASLGLLTACALVPERDPMSLYSLPSTPLPTASSGETGSLERTLRLATPRAGGLLDGSRIVVVPAPNQPQVYQGVRWSDASPVLLRDRLIDAFQEDGRVSRLVHADTPLSADLELTSDLRAFQSEYRNGHPEVVIRLDARLVDASSQQLVASRRFTHRRSADDTTIPAVVDAFGTAADQLSRELVDWTVEQLAHAR